MRGDRRVALQPPCAAGAPGRRRRRGHVSFPAHFSADGSCSRRSPRRRPIHARVVLVARHVDFVGVLFVVWGVVTALIGLSTLALGVGGASLATSPNLTGGGAVGVAAGALITPARVSLVWGAGHRLVG